MTTLSDTDFTELEIQAVLQKLAVAVKLLESVCAIKDAVKKLKNHPSWTRNKINSTINLLNR